MPDTKPETATVKLTSAEQAVADAAIARFRREGKRECLKAVGIPAMILICFVAYFSHYIPDDWTALRIGIQSVCVVVTLSALIGTTVLMFKNPKRTWKDVTLITGALLIAAGLLLNAALQWFPCLSSVPALKVVDLVLLVAGIAPVVFCLILMVVDGIRTVQDYRAGRYKKILDSHF